MQNNFRTCLWTRPSHVLTRWIPSAIGIYIIGHLISIIIVSTGKPFSLENAIISDLLSPINNPNGYLISVFAAILSGLILLPTATLFQNSWPTRLRFWPVLGSWLYRLGLITVILIGISTPFQMPYVPSHIWLSYAALVSILCGLSICLGLALYFSDIMKVLISILLVLLVFEIAYLFYLMNIPDYFIGRRWLLAIFEWGLYLTIGIGIVTVTAVQVRIDRENM